MHPSPEALRPLPDVRPDVDVFLSRYGQGPAHAERVAALEAYGNEAFYNTTPEAMVLVPVALQDEDITATLDAIREQQEFSGTPPFWTVLSCNYVAEGADFARIARNLQALDTYQREHPEFAVSCFVQRYPTGVPIGEIRADLFAAGIDAYARRIPAGQPLPDIALFSWDADTERVTPGYIADGVESMRNSDAAQWVGYPVVVHGKTGLPNMDAALGWRDISTRFHPVIQPQHFAVNLGGYARARGFRGDSIAEHDELIRRMDLLDPDGFEAAYLAGNRATVSPRQLAAQLARDEYAEYGELFTVEGSPGYRVRPLRHDIDEDTLRGNLEHAISISLSQTFDAIRDDAIHEEGAPLDQANQEALRFTKAVGEAGLWAFGERGAARDVVRDIIRIIERYI
jgi:hypothetical protein